MRREQNPNLKNLTQAVERLGVLSDGIFFKD